MVSAAGLKVQEGNLKSAVTDSQSGRVGLHRCLFNVTGLLLLCEYIFDKSDYL